MAKNVHELGDTNFETEVLQSEVPVLVDFWASWCRPCLMIAPYVEALADEFAGRVKVGKVNLDEAQATVRRFGVTSIPTLILFKNGKAVDQIVGAVPKENIQSLIEKAL
jgi:thioredoxin 1